MGSNAHIRPQMVISFIFCVGFIAVLLILFGGTEAVHKNMMSAAMYTLGILSAVLTQIMSYWFGESATGTRLKKEEGHDTPRL